MTEAVEPTSEVDDDAFPVTIEHALGETTIEEEPTRVVTVGYAEADFALALGVVPVGAAEITYAGNENGSSDFFDEALAEIDGAEQPVRLDETDGVPVERIVRLEPDLVTATASGMTQEEHDRLTEAGIPVVAYPEAPYTTTWQESLDLVGRALGRSGLADEVEAETEQLFDDTAAEHPQLEGATFVFARTERRRRLLLLRLHARRTTDRGCSPSSAWRTPTSSRRTRGGPVPVQRLGRAGRRARRRRLPDLRHLRGGGRGPRRQPADPPGPRHRRRPLVRHRRAHRGGRLLRAVPAVAAVRARGVRAARRRGPRGRRLRVLTRTGEGEEAAVGGRWDCWTGRARGPVRVPPARRSCSGGAPARGARLGRGRLPGGPAAGAARGGAGPGRAGVARGTYRARRLVGAALGLAGAAMQGLTRNPLADPGILGVNAGAALAIVLGIVHLGAGGLHAFVRARVPRSRGRLGRRCTPWPASAGTAPPRPKLTVAGAAFAAAAGSWTVAVQMVDRTALDVMRRWQVGSLGGRDWDTVGTVAPVLLGGVVAALLLGRTLNSLALGDDLARGLGRRTGRDRVLVGVAIVLLAGTATAVAGPDRLRRPRRPAPGPRAPRGPTTACCCRSRRGTARCWCCWPTRSAGWCCPRRRSRSAS